MPYACETLIRSTQPVLSVRTRAPVQDLPEIIGPIYGQIMAYLTEQGEAPCGEPFVAYYNLDMQDLDMEIGFPVSRVLAGKGSIQAGEIPSGKFVACLYTGPYERMEVAYDALQQYIAGSGRQASGVAYEFYLNGPDQVPPEQYRTRILMPLAP